MIDDVHLTHGLAGDELEPDWPPLVAPEVGVVLEHYPQLGGLRALAWRSPRPLSAAALVDTAQGRVFMKRHHRSVRTPAQLEEEHHFSAHLRGRGMPVPRVLAMEDGATVLKQGQWVYEIHDPARGRDIYRDAFSWSPIGGVKHAWAAGAMLGRLHLAAEGYDAPQRSTDILVARAEILSDPDPVASMADQLSHRPHLDAYLRRHDWKTQVSTAIAPWHRSAWDGIAHQAPLWTHGDWHVSNLCWSDDGDAATITDVLDFGLSARTFALFDLATAIERNAIAWLDVARGDIARTDLALALLRGYRSVRPLTAEDVALLADVLPLVHIDFALSEVEYFEGITRRPDHADVAYHTFLRGHAAWFAGPYGRAFLDFLRYAV